MYWDWHPYYKKTKPREVKGGIKFQGRQRSSGGSWWALRWIQVLESFKIGARLSRGRSYARRGQVVSIDISEGKVEAKVQGSRPRPYTVHIKIKTLSQGQWQKVAREFSKQALYSAELLNGRIPEDAETIFTKAGLSLFPSRGSDLDTKCSCPDWSNPCKHIAAVYYILGEEFDRDPFLIFRLRGIQRSELLKMMRQQPVKVAETKGRKSRSLLNKVRQTRVEPLPENAVVFWGKGSNFFLGKTAGEVVVSHEAVGLAQRLGNFPFWRGTENFLSVLGEVYRRASPTGLKVFLNGQIDAGINAGKNKSNEAENRYQRRHYEKASH